MYKGKVTLVPVHTVTACGGGRGSMTPHVLNLSISIEVSAQFHAPTVLPLKHTAPITGTVEQLARWAAEANRPFGYKRDSLALSGFEHTSSFVQPVAKFLPLSRAPQLQLAVTSDAERR